MIQKKVCMLGGFGVGKTSLVARFVHSRFSDQYLSTMGVKVDRKGVDVDGRHVNMMLWDIYGEEDNRKVASSYLRGTSGAILVADGTRPQTLETTEVLLKRLQDTVGDVPSILLINKHDLSDQWAVTEDMLAALQGGTRPVYLSSAKTGEHVETAFHTLAGLMVAD